MGDLRPGDDGWLILASSLASLAYVSRDLVIARRARQLLERRPYRGQPVSPTPSQLDRSAARAELGPPKQSSPIKQGEHWRIYDAVFDVWGESRSGRVKTAEAYYTVFEARLRRSVPQLVFDSKTAKKRQFSHIYLRAQHLPLEAILLDDFDAYAPQHYEIDALSFITPEVVEAMPGLADRDIEFVGPGLLCYAPLLDDDEIEVFRTRCLNLYQQVNDNLANYRDSWAKYLGQGSIRFGLGRRLVKDPYRYRHWVVLSGSVSAGLIFLALVTDRAGLVFNRASLMIIRAFCILLADMSWAGRRNRRLQAIAATLTRLDQG